MITRLELFIDQLDGQLGRRRKELTDIRFVSLTSSGTTAGTIRRAAHLLAYAHWEGFSKDALTQYINYLCNARLKISSLQLPLQALNYWQTFKAVSNSLDLSSVVNLVREFEERDIRHFSVDANKTVKTGNLDSGTLRKLLDACALEYLSTYQTRERFIDKVLCGRRHRIAHGALEPVSADDLATVLDGVLELCQQLKEQIQDALIYDRYNRDLVNLLGAQVQPGLPFPVAVSLHLS